MVAVSLFQTKQIKYENRFKLLFVHVLAPGTTGSIGCTSAMAAAAVGISAGERGNVGECEAWRVES